MRHLILVKAPPGWGLPDWSAKCRAKAIEARRAETLGSVEDESAVPQGFAQKEQFHDPS